MSDDVEPEDSTPEPEAAVEPAPSGAVVAAGSAQVATVDHGLQLARQAEHNMLTGVWKASAVAIPICVVIWALIMVLAIAGDGWSMTIPLVIAGVVGAFAGAFFGGWAGVLAKAHALDDADREAALMAHGGQTVGTSA